MVVSASGTIPEDKNSPSTRALRFNFKKVVASSSGLNVVRWRRIAQDVMWVCGLE
jgi:hypothetical protein